MLVIPNMVMTFDSDLSLQPQPEAGTPTLNLKSTIEELPLWDVQFHPSCLGYEVTKQFDANPLIPGVLIVAESKLVGMISRRRFLEFMSRPYGLEVFTKRSLKTLLNFIPPEILVLEGDTLIVTAARQSLQRCPESLYEPIVVKITPQEYRLVDVHKLLVAQAQIHELTTQLLHEQTQIQLLQTEKMASLGRMVAGVAHEMRNPVNCIGGNFSFLANYFQDLMQLLVYYEAENTEPSAQITAIKEKIDFDFLIQDLPEILTSIKLSSTRLTQIISSLQSFSHIDENKRKPADIHECIESALLILKHSLKQGIEIIKNYENLPLIPCYSGQLSQVFMNLLSNAIDAITEKGTASKKCPSKIEITTQVLNQEKPECVVITIADNGVGISPEIQNQIFENFFTTKPVGKGTGLGLAISHQIITQKHRGQLRVFSQPGVGTKFQILLPLL